MTVDSRELVMNMRVMMVAEMRSRRNITMTAVMVRVKKTFTMFEVMGRMRMMMRMVKVKKE